MSSLLDRFVVVLSKLISRLPFWAIFWLADVLYAVLYYLVGYRRKVVLENMKNSFPEKEPAEIKKNGKKVLSAPD